jgi:hypothetical protein
MTAPTGRRRTLPAVAVSWLLAAAGAVLVACLPRWLDPGLATAALRLWALNALPFLLLWVLAWGVTRRPVTAAALVSLFAAALYSANRLKLQYLELPLLPADLVVATQVAGNPALFVRYLDINPLFLLLPVAVLLLWRYEPLPRRRFRLARVAAAAGVLLLLAGLPRGAPPWSHWYGLEQLNAAVWVPQQAAEDLGVVALFVHLAQSAWQGPPAADRGVLARFETLFGMARDARLEAGLPPQLPDLIVVQSESFFDPARLAGVDSRPLLPHFHRLAARHHHGELAVPAFGGLTTRTEFEVLTGIPLQTLPGVQYPYQGLVHRPLRSLPWALKSLGYATRAVHPYERRFYRRDRVYPLLGFDSFHTMSEFGAHDRHGHFVSDAALTRRVIEIVEAGAPQFVFAVSMENHGPWDETRPLPADELATIDVPADLDAGSAREFRSFLHHLQRSDAALGELADWVERRERPTLLLFYGDHLPGLPEVFSQLGFADGLPGNRQPVPWLLVDNRREKTGSLALDSHDLPALLLDAASINRDPYLIATSLVRSSDELDSAERQRLRQHLASASFATPPAAGPEALHEGIIATVRGWGPRGAEALGEGLPEGRFWVEFEETPPRGTYLRLSDRRLDVTWTSDRRVSGLLSPFLTAGLFARPGTLAFTAVDPLRGRVQRIGDVEVRPPAERAVLADGRRAQRLCAVEAWGPERAEDASDSRQPDGSLGVWVRAACLPHDARLMIDDVVLGTSIEDRVATAGVPADWLRAGRQLPIRLLDAGGEWLDVGYLRVSD